MKTKQIIIITALLLAAIAPIKAQDWHRINDTTWVSYTNTTQGVITDYAYQVDQAMLIEKHNNNMRTFGLLQLGCMASEGIAFAATMYNMNKYGGNKDSLKGAAFVFGLAGLGMGIGSIGAIVQDKVYLTPEGIIVKIGRTEKPKYDNKKPRKHNH